MKRLGRFTGESFRVEDVSGVLPLGESPPAARTVHNGASSAPLARSGRVLTAPQFSPRGTGIPFAVGRCTPGGRAGDSVRRRGESASGWRYVARALLNHEREEIMCCGSSPSSPTLVTNAPLKAG